MRATALRGESLVGTAHDMDGPGLLADDAKARISWPVVGVAAMVLLTVGVHVWLATKMRVPIIHPDEFGSLDIGRYLVRGGQRLQTEYYPGFGVLLAPVWVFTRSATTVYRAALFVNGVLAGLCWLGVWSLVRRLAPSRSMLGHSVIATLTCLYPPVVVGTDLVWSETLFITAFVGMTLLAARAFAEPTVRRWVVLGIATTGLVLGHPRGLAVAVATVATAGLCLRPTRAHLRPLVAIAGTLFVGLVSVEVVVHLLGSRPPAGFHASYDASGIVARQFSLTAVRRLVLEAFGQLWYVSVATLGIVPIGVGTCVYALRRVLRGNRGVPEQLVTYCLASFVSVWALATLFADNGTRGDQLVYGRYLEGVAVPMIAIGLLTVSGLAKRMIWWRISGASVAFLAAAAFVVRYGYRSAELNFPVNPANVLAIHPSLRGGHLNVWAATIPALVIAGLLALLAARRPWAAAALLAVVAIFVSGEIQRNYLVPGSVARGSPGQTAIATTIARIDRLGLAPRCVAWDASVPVDLQFYYWADRYRRPLAEFNSFDPTRGQRPCGALVITDRQDFSARYPKSQLIVAGGATAQNLWVLDSPLQARLKTAGFLPR